MTNGWDKTETKPNDDRFVMLVLSDGKEREAQYKEPSKNIFREGKDWVDRNGKYSAVGFNPAVSWREI